MIKQVVYSAGIEETVYLKIKDEIIENNRKSLIFFSALVAGVLGILFGVSLTVSSLSGFRHFYAGCCIPTVLILIFSILFGKKNKRVVAVGTYLLLSIVLLIGMLLGTVAAPGEITATYIAIMLTAPQLFVDRPYRMYIYMVINIAIFVVMVLTFKDPVTWRSDITNCITFGFLSLVLYTYMTSFKAHRFSLEYTVRLLAESDQLTHLKNRNSYEQRLSEIEDMHADSVHCIYMDANGLHELNNTQGHAAGDRMLQRFAVIMQEIFGEEDTFRIGGDEFVVLGTGIPASDIERMTAALRLRIDGEGYHAAIGYACVQGSDLNTMQLIRRAETEMYKDKQEYYRRNPNVETRNHLHKQKGMGRSDEA